jgi:hypothetical protein
VTTLPFSRVPDPLDAPVIRWGVLAPGGIAHRWTAALHARTTSRVVAAGSRSLERAEAFVSEFGVERAYGSYESLVGLDVSGEVAFREFVEASGSRLL